MVRTQRMSARARVAIRIAGLIIGVIVAFNAISLSVTLRSSAPTSTQVYSSEAKAMTTSGISSIIPDAAASGSQAVKLWNNGDSVSAKAIFPTSAWYAFAFAGRQDYYGGTNAHISLYTEKSGTSAGDTYVSSTSNYQTYTIDAWLSAGWHSFKLVFDNDAWGGTPILDRNVYIDTVSVAMTTIPPYTILGRAYYIDCNGADTNVGTSAHSAWQSLSKASSVELNPGDTLLFKRSCSWWGALTLNSSGT